MRCDCCRVAYFAFKATSIFRRHHTNLWDVWSGGNSGNPHRKVENVGTNSSYGCSKIKWFSDNNKQNCHYWSATNSRRKHEEPLDSSQVTVQSAERERGSGREREWEWERGRERGGEGGRGIEGGEKERGRGGEREKFETPCTTYTNEKCDAIIQERFKLWKINSILIRFRK